jgi:hypothetical protein
MSTSTSPAFSAAVLGQTEKTLNAILDRQLSGTGLTEHQWITLTLTVGGAADGGSVDRDQLISRLTGGLRVSDAEAQARIAELAAAHLLVAPDGEGSVTVTDAGRQLHGQIGSAVTRITHRLWGDLPADDLATAARVLTTVLERANAELTAA